MTEDRKLPQLVMRRPALSDLPEVVLPENLQLRHFKPGDEDQWESIVDQAFGWQRNFQQHMSSHPYFKPERVWFVCDGETPIATAGAWYKPEWGEACGYLHMVGAYSWYAGQGLGYAVSLAAMLQMREDGRQEVVLETDDFRIPAIKTYLKLGFHPEAGTAELQERWRHVYRSLRLTFGEGS
ncbi:GNAT family N-acetyltransferase [Paenibacillus sepulcri]|uniref:GNAT family N-acetyltransferase n=1 Tax=Paenibacillus sepulcri TaxID=359917 RepID=A0ABS7C861_9BACL|nr:GNAT family N-acetyltransferase [Paenibacillus sepulcri]